MRKGKRGVGEPMKLQNLPHGVYLPVVLQFKRGALHRLGISLGCLPSPNLVKRNKPKEVRQLDLGLAEIVPQVPQKSPERCKTEVKNRMRSQDESEIGVCTLAERRDRV